ncbi:MAG TPA: recombinase family protein [Bryobacteraceae bacterium]|jgi:hypothetical protein|nr:recombinase family protein [Bryobacteraceae bacterium]
MPQHIRDLISMPLTLEYFNRRTADGWVMQAVEWTKSTEAKEPASSEEGQQEVPYGMRVAKDCGHLVEDEYETSILLLIYEQVVAGRRPVQIAADLNERGYRTRRAAPWTPGAVFDLLPRLIEASPRLQKRPDWPSRRAKLEIIA